MNSVNFEFLSSELPGLAATASRAELYLHNDPNACLLKIRQFGEEAAKLVAVNAGLSLDAEEVQFELLNRLERRGILPVGIARLFHQIRISGNAASHAGENASHVAESSLRAAFDIATWYVKTFNVDCAILPQRFITPPSVYGRDLDAVDPSSPILQVRNEAELISASSFRADAGPDPRTGQVTGLKGKLATLALVFIVAVVAAVFWWRYPWDSARIQGQYVDEGTSQTALEIVVNLRTHVYHAPKCEWAQRISRGHIALVRNWQEAEAAGNRPCSACKGGR